MGEAITGQDESHIMAFQLIFNVELDQVDENHSMALQLGPTEAQYGDSIIKGVIMFVGTVCNVETKLCVRIN